MTELDKSLTAMDWLPTLGSGAPGTSSTQASPRLASSMNLVSSTGELLGAARAATNGQAANGAGEGGGTTQGGQSTEVKSVVIDGKVYEKPPYSYANLITLAIHSQPQKRMTLSEIYQWICENFPYYREVGSGWKVRIALFHDFSTVTY